MLIPEKFIYLFGLAPFCIIWGLFFYKRKDLRKEMIIVSVGIGIISVLSSYFWWTRDWWRPLNITGTLVGLEDFIMGFTSGGIITSFYKIILNDVLYAKYKIKNNNLIAIFVLLSMAILTAFLIEIIGLTTFWSSVITMVLIVVFFCIVRKDLILDSFFSGLAMALISVLFYFVIISLSKTWIGNTYLDGLSGLRFCSIPIEEFIFWFLAGMWVAPFYEYILGKKLRHSPKKRRQS